MASSIHVESIANGFYMADNLNRYYIHSMVSVMHDQLSDIDDPIQYPSLQNVSPHLYLPLCDTSCYIAGIFWLPE